MLRVTGSLKAFESVESKAPMVSHAQQRPASQAATAATTAAGAAAECERFIPV